MKTTDTNQTKIDEQNQIAPAIKNEPSARTLDKFEAEIDGEDNSVLGKRYLCRGGALLLAAPTGIGKSAFVIQGGIQWALGKSHFGIKPPHPLRILYIQAENDDGDIMEFRNGVFDGLGMTEVERSVACSNFFVYCESVKTSRAFILLLEELIVKHHPDIVIIDPLFAYCGCNVSDQEKISIFLRNWLNPILQNNECAALVVHHTNKPSRGQEKSEWQAGDFAYLGSGSSELANWPRAVIGIKSIGSHSVYEVHLSKRGRRLDLKDQEGSAIYHFFIKHSDTGICWEEATEQEASNAKTESKKGVKGAPLTEDRLATMRKDMKGKGIAISAFQRECEERHGIAKSVFYRLWVSLKNECELDILSKRWRLKNDSPYNSETKALLVRSQSQPL